MNKNIENELHLLAEQYATIFLTLANVIENNDLDYDETWDKINQHLDYVIELSNEQ